MKSFEYIKIVTFVVKSFFILLLLLLLALSGLMFIYSYGEFTNLLLKFYGKLDRLSVFQTDYFTLNSFNRARQLLCILTILLLISFFRLKVITSYVSEKLWSVVNSLRLFSYYLRESYTSLSVREKVFFFVLLLVMSSIKFYFLTQFPFHVDELASYLFFVKRGLFVSISYFPGPNNHIFYSVLACIFKPFIADPFYLMKIPSFISGIIASLVLFLFLNKHFNYFVSIVGTVVFSFMFNYFVYSISGRGYALMTLFTMISTIVTLEIVSGRTDKYLWHIYTISGILGFYTLFTFLYPLFALSTVIAFYIIIQRNYALAKPFIYYSILIAGFVFLMYTPVFIISGISAISSNPWMIKLDWSTYFSKLPNFISGAFEFILNIENFQVSIGTSVILLSIIILIKSKKYNWLWVIVSFFISPVILLSIQRLQPYNRVWIYLIFPMSICLIVILDYLFTFISKFKYVQITLSLIISIFIVVTALHTANGMTKDKQLMYDNVDRITSNIVQQNNVKVYTNDDSYNLFLRYHSLQIGEKEVVPEMAALPSINEFDYVLLTKDMGFPASIDSLNYVLKERDRFIKVYKHK